jgi:hypothetical protein
VPYFSLTSLPRGLGGEVEKRDIEEVKRVKKKGWVGGIGMVRGEGWRRAWRRGGEGRGRGGERDREKG